MSYNFIRELLDNNLVIYPVLTILSVIIFSYVINNVTKKIKKRKIELEKNQQEELVCRLKRITSLRDKGAISKKEFKERRELLFKKASNSGKLGRNIAGIEPIESYCKAVEKANECIIVIQDNEIKFASITALRTLGYLKGNLISKNIREYIHPNDYKSFSDYQKKRIKDENFSGKSIFRFIEGNNENRWFELNSVLITWHKKPATINFLTDITGQKKAEEELKEMRDRYHTLFEDSPISIWELDISDLQEYINGLKEEGVYDFRNYFIDNPGIVSICFSMLKIINANKSNIQLFEIEDKIEVINFLNQIIKKDLFDVFLKWFTSIIEGKATYEAETTFKTSKGKERHAILKWIIVPTNNQIPIKALLSVTDITEHKNIMNKIRKLSQFRESIIKNANVWLNVLDSNLNVLVWNKAAENISGYLKNEVKGNNKIWQWLYPDEGYRKKIIGYILSINDKNEVIEDFETTIRCKNGENKIIIWNSKYLIDSDEKKIGTIIIGRDYTDRKKMEEKLKHIATHDTLTNLYNRAFFEEQLHLQFKEREARVGILVLDIDGLKYVNDTLGHQQGDRLIADFARILNETFRPSDVIARIGGDEFSVLMRDINENKIINIVKRLKKNIEKYNRNLKINHYPLNVSFGYSVRDNNKTAIQIFKEADDMLFEKKISKKEYV